MLGWPELVLIFVVLLLVVGPSKMPEMARTLGQAMKEFRKATTELEQSVIGEGSTTTGQLPVVPSRSTVALSDASGTDSAKSEGAVKPQDGLEDVAHRLGIETGDKSKEQIRKEILDKVNEMEKNA